MSAAPAPTITGPLTNGAYGRPFGSPLADPAEAGYTIEEFILDGSATAFRAASRPAADDGHWHTEPDRRADFATRVYVVRPVDPAAFNGVAVVNWQNVTAGFDIGAPINPELFRGYAWVGVSAQKVGLDGIAGQTPGLRAWDAERYGNLHHPGDAWSYDMFAQAGRLVREGTLLGGLSPTTVIAAGGSQSAMRLATYLNAAHRHHRVFDGFHLIVHWGICPPLAEVALPDMFRPTDGQPSPWLSRIRDDNGVPVMIVATECEARFNLPVRQPDSATLRFWEIAGAAHQSPSQAQTFALMMMRDGLPAAPAHDDRNAVEWRYVSDAALRALRRWVTEGVAPPVVPRIEFDAGGTLQRDALGNAAGGLRVPELEAPVATYRGERDDNSGNPDWLQGRTTPLDSVLLRELYPAQAAHAEAWTGAVERLVDAQLVLREDIGALMARGQPTN